MTLYDICLEIARVENDLADGYIRVNISDDDKWIYALKPGHPADILDDIFGSVGNELCYNPSAIIATSDLQEMLEELEGFSGAFGVKELAEPIENLRKFIAEREAQENGN